MPGGWWTDRVKAPRRRSLGSLLHQAPEAARGGIEINGNALRLETGRPPGAVNRNSDWPWNCPCQLPKPGLSSHQQPNRSIERLYPIAGVPA
jgi:hypothetical protein